MLDKKNVIFTDLIQICTDVCCKRSALQMDAENGGLQMKVARP